MGVDAIYVAKTFYVLESLRFIVDSNSEFGKKSHEKLMLDIMEYRSRYIASLKRALYDYTALAVFGEMRHGLHHSTHYMPSIPEGGTREGSYVQALAYNPTSILLAGERLFSEKWENGLGGEKWRIIANRVQLMDKIDDTVYCDMCFSLTHNNSPYLDKSTTGIFEISDCSAYKRVLDYKFEEENPSKVIERFISSVGVELKKLISRAINLGFIEENYETNYYLTRYRDSIANKVERYILNYEPLRWQGKWLDNTIIKHRWNLQCQPKDIQNGALNPRHVKEGEIVVVMCDNVDGFSSVKKGMKAKVIEKYGGCVGVEFEEFVNGTSLINKCKYGHGLYVKYCHLEKETA